MMKQILLINHFQTYEEEEGDWNSKHSFRKVKSWLTSLIDFYKKICLGGQGGSSRSCLPWIQQGFSHVHSTSSDNLWNKDKMNEWWDALKGGWRPGHKGLRLAAQNPSGVQNTEIPQGSVLESVQFNLFIISVLSPSLQRVEHHKEWLRYQRAVLPSRGTWTGWRNGLAETSRSSA